MANTPIPQDNDNHRNGATEPLGAQDAESLDRLAGLLAEVSGEIDQLRAHLNAEAPEEEGPVPDARTPDPPSARGRTNSRMSGDGEPVDTSFAGPRTPAARAAGVSRLPGESRWPGWFAVAAALCGAALLVITAAASPGLLSPTQIVGGFALGAGLFGLWSSR